MIRLEPVIVDYFGVCSHAFFDAVDQVVKQSHDEVGAFIGRQELPYPILHPLGALNQVPNCIANFVLDLTDVFLVLSFNPFNRFSQHLPCQLV